MADTWDSGFGLWSKFWIQHRITWQNILSFLSSRFLRPKCVPHSPNFLTLRVLTQRQGKFIAHNLNMNKSSTLFRSLHCHPIIVCLGLIICIQDFQNLILQSIFRKLACLFGFQNFNKALLKSLLLAHFMPSYFFSSLNYLCLMGHFLHMDSSSYFSFMSRFTFKFRIRSSDLYWLSLLLNEASFCCCGLVSFVCFSTHSLSV